MKFNLVILCFVLVVIVRTSAKDDDLCDNSGSDCNEPVKKKKSFKELYSDLMKNLASIKASCGELCNVEDITGTPDKYFDRTVKDFNCNELFANELIDEETKFSFPPQKIPKYLTKDFSYAGQAEIRYHYYDEMGDQSKHLIKWEDDFIDEIREAFRKGNLVGSYGAQTVHDIYNYITSEKMNVSGQHVLIIGSQKPWVEGIVLEAGARHITTLDYVKIWCNHPQITTTTPDKLRKQFQNPIYRPQFDAIISFSSVEHSGLGRYGDQLNPWGDLIAMGRAHCLLKSGHRALVGIPVGPDIVRFNGDRIYGPKMLPHLFANWKQVDSNVDFSKFNEKCIFCYQPLFLLEK